MARQKKFDKPTPQTEHGGVPQPSKKKSQAVTMEELLAQTGYALKGVKKGDIVEGTVTRVGRREVTVDIGGKTEGVVIDRELETYRDTIMALQPGDHVTAQVIVSENDRGQSVLSLRKSIFEKQWTDLVNHQKNSEPIEILLKEQVRGGMLVDSAGLRGYIPQSQFDTAAVKQLDKMVGRRIFVKVMEVDQVTNRLIFSQRAMTEEANLAKQKELLELVKVGDSVEATVTGVVPFGAFAKFSVEKDGEKKDIEGLIHISEIAWEKVEDIQQYLKTNDTIKVKIVGIDEKTGKLTLSLKQLLPDPWEHVLDMFEKDTQVKGKVSRVSPYGVFVNLTPGVDGLIHISKISPGEEPKVGDEITVNIEDIQPDKRKISLSMTLKEKPIGYR
jgi:ribosomal protein S1